MHDSTTGQGWVLALAGAVCLAVGCAGPPRAAAPGPASVVQAGSQATTLPEQLLDERFQHSWPSDPHGTAWLGANSYTLFARQPGQFVAVRAPLPDVPRDMTVSGTFHKVGGPPGGGYGIIVRDQSTGAGDGVDQTGQFLVAAAGDRGQVGIWQRSDLRWIDLLPWTPSPLVHAGSATNELKVELVADRLRFEVNGGHVADVEVGFSRGSIGVFVGGDLNQVQVDRLQVDAAPTNNARIAAEPAPAPTPDIPAARSRLNTLAAQASQNSSVMQDPAWQQEMAAALAMVEQIAGNAPPSPTAGGSLPDPRQLRALLGGIADDLASILGAFATGVDSPNNPLNSPRALDQAATHLNSAVGQADQVLAEVEAARNAPQASASSP